jgi:asparagine N-glycosylation enzyme membrane subunit Stt3
MSLANSPGRLVELVIAVMFLVAGVWLYRRRDKSDTYGSQGAVILLVVAVIMAIHALGALDYHPSAAEAEYYRANGR